MEIQVTPSNSKIGAEVRGIDLRTDLNDETAAQLRNMFYQHSVICVRDQQLSEQDFIRFSRALGDLETHFLSEYQRPGFPEIYVVSNIIENGKPIGIADAGLEWHTDSSWAPQPSAATCLYAVEVPMKDGIVVGDTLFASMTAAYDALSDKTKELLISTRAKHGYAHRHEQRRKVAGSSRKPLTEEQKSRSAGSIHPVIREHPVTGRKCVYVNRWFTTELVGLPKDVGSTLLGELFDQITKDEYVYRHHWCKGDVLLWDNCAVQHKAIRDYAFPQRRLMWRTTVRGSSPN